MTAFGNDVFIALAFVVLLVCSSAARQQLVNARPDLPASELMSRMQAADDAAGGKHSDEAADPLADSVPLDRKAYAALVIGSSLDLATSLRALAHRPGAYEWNPLLAHGGTQGLVAGKVATTAGLVWAMQRIAKGGHPTLAKVIGWTGGIALSGVALHNATTR